MGFASDIANKVRSFFSKDKETAAKQLSRGVSSDRFSGSASDLLNTVGSDGLSEFLRLDSDLLARYADYEDMDDYPELAAALDILADDATQPNTPINRTMWVTSKDQTAAQTLDDLYHRTLRMDEEIWEIARNLVKYGNNYEELLVTGNGVVGLNFLPTPTMRRVEADKGELLGFVQDYKGKYVWTPQEFDAALKQRSAEPSSFSVGATSKVTAFEGWEVTHYRLRGKFRRSLYGYSALEPARWIWKRLVLLEDAALIYRLQRAPERFAFYIDVGDLPPQEALGYVNRVRQQFKKKKWVNPTTGRLDMKFDPLSQDEDFFVPSRKGSDSARIETLGAPQWQCLVGDTRVPLLDGSSPTIEELSKRGGEFWLYSIDSKGRVVPGKGRAARQTHAAADIWEVELDNGEKVRCTGNHPFLMRDGKWSLAEHLRPGDSLMPLYRKESFHESGDKVEGYEKVYDPASDGWVYTHHRVFEETTGTDLLEFFKHGKVIHHTDFNKRNNAPTNLEGMTRSDHTKLHTEHTENLKWTPARHKKHRKMMVERMADKVLRVDKAKLLTEWNKSAERRKQISGAGHPRWNDLDVAGLEYLVLATGARGLRELMQRGRIGQSTIARVLKAEGLTWNQFAQKNIPGWEAKGRALHVTNHKVVSVRKTGEKAAVFDLTVENHANFAISQGIFVSNSMDDIEYFRDKMFAAIKVPKAYLAQEAGVARAVLSSEDVRFARTVLRIQRELINGSRKIGRVHLSALGVDPTRVEWDLNMTVPSAVFELAQIEVRNARADLANRMREFVSMHWMLSNVFALSDKEIETIFEQRQEDDARVAVSQAQAQAAQQAVMSSVPGGGMDMGGGGMVAPEASAPEVEVEPGAEVPVESAATTARALREGRIRLSPGARSTRSRPFTERELFAGDRESERRATEKLDILIKSDRRVAARIEELRGLMTDLKGAMGAMGGRRR